MQGSKIFFRGDDIHRTGPNERDQMTLLSSSRRRSTGSSRVPSDMIAHEFAMPRPGGVTGQKIQAIERAIPANELSDFCQELLMGIVIGHAPLPCLTSHSCWIS